MTKPEPLSFEKQLDLFAERGMDVKPDDIHKLEQISYYRIKEFARPLSTAKNENGQSRISYEGISFSDVLTRYYQDKNLRIFLLHAIEKIEISLKTKVSYILGSKYGAFGYLDFSNWCDRQRNSKYTVEKKQYYFKKGLQTAVSRSYSSDIKKSHNQETDGFPTVWLAFDVLTFGELVRIIEMMSASNQRLLAQYYGCTAKELVSWIKCLHFIRNVCAHNSNVIDLKLKTSPIYRKEWNSFLYQFSSGKKNERASNRIAVVLVILKHFVCMINSQYSWRNIAKSITTICAGKERNANLLGFKSLSQVIILFPKKNGKL